MNKQMDRTKLTSSYAYTTPTQNQEHQKQEIDNMLEEFFTKQSFSQSNSSITSYKQLSKQQNGRNYFQFGNKKVELQYNSNKKLVVKVGGGFMELGEFIQVFQKEGENTAKKKR